MPTITTESIGLISTFGGPKDLGVSPSEGLALFSPSDLGKPVAGDLFLPVQPPGTTGLARRLNPAKHYIAMRWDYKELPRELLRRMTVSVHAKGVSATDARPVDWGPNRGTGRLMDISPGLAATLGIHTDEEATVSYSYELSKRGFVNPSSQMSMEGDGPLTDEEIEDIATQTCTELTLPEGARLDKRLSIWGDRGRFWPEDATLRVRFKNGTPEQKEKMWKRFQMIDALCGLSFKRVSSGPTDIRVAFNRGSGHWSYVGTDNLSIPSQHQTMNIDLAGNAPDSEYDRVGLHEILHAAGFSHEHQHPRDRVKWNKPAVYQYYSKTQGWSKRQIDQQVMTPGDPDEFFGTEKLHTDSLMMYATHPKLVLDPAYAAGWNTTMSPEDIQQLQIAYPNGPDLREFC